MAHYLSTGVFPPNRFSLHLTKFQPQGLKEISFRTCILDHILNCKLLCLKRHKANQSHLLFIDFEAAGSRHQGVPCWCAHCTRFLAQNVFAHAQDFGEENECIEVLRITLQGNKMHIPHVEILCE